MKPASWTLQRQKSNNKDVSKGFISEIYCTWQGEGIALGERQVFVRMAGCPLRCVWCDTPESLGTRGHPALDPPEIARRIRRAAVPAARTVSITGGEPLAQVDCLESLLPLLKAEGWRVYLETAGVHAEALKRVIDRCDVVSMDIKLPSAVGRSFWREHADFLRIGGEKTFVKIVLTDNSSDEEVQRACELMAAHSRDIPLVLQPVTPIPVLSSRWPSRAAGTRGSRPPMPVRPPEPMAVLRWFDLAKRWLSDVRIIVQLHPLWGVP